MLSVIGNRRRSPTPLLPTSTICSKPLVISRRQLDPLMPWSSGTERQVGLQTVSCVVWKRLQHNTDALAGGSDYHDDKYGKDSTAVASTVNAQTFFTEGVCAALKWNINVFYFEAFAEPWKPVTKGANKGDGDETHWGAFSADRKLLIKDLSCAYPAKSEL